jgi:hypothetical protein
MIQAFVDESGISGSPVLVFSALLADAERWALFSDEWAACLKQAPSIRYFKMDHAAGPNGEFYGFSDDERDSKLVLLCSVLNRLAPTEVSTSVDMDQFAKGWGKTADRPLSEPYFFPFHVIDAAVANAVSAIGIRERYEIFFDENNIFGPRAKAWYPIIKTLLSEEMQEVMPIEPFFRSDADVLPLQAADLLAWMVRQRKVGGDACPFAFDWLDEELSHVKRSPSSTHISWEQGAKLPEKDNEYFAKRQDALRAYQETFGHEWPPKNKMEQKKMRGR